MAQSSEERKEVESSEKDKPCLTKNDDAASVSGIMKKNARQRVGAVRSQSRESNDPKRER